MLLHSVSSARLRNSKNKTIMQKMHKACKLVPLSHTYFYAEHLLRYKKNISFSKLKLT